MITILACIVNLGVLIYHAMDELGKSDLDNLEDDLDGVEFMVKRLDSIEKKEQRIASRLDVVRNRPGLFVH